MHIRIEGTLDYRKSKQYFPHAFTVPAGTNRLAINFEYSPRVAQGQILQSDLSLTLFDPEKARGARHCNPDQNLILTNTTATPGYIPGPLLPGVWTVWIDAHRVLPPDTIQYTFDIEMSEYDAPGERASGLHWPLPALAPRGPGWYRGDLHGHTLHSDAEWDVPEYVQNALGRGLDFTTLTDHNTGSSLAQVRSMVTDQMLTMGGVELTTYYGHALALGVDRWQEWRTGLDGVTMPELAERAMRNGALYIIAHPHSVGDPECTGCDWSYADMMPGNSHHVEVWNGAWGGDSGNAQALATWYRWLNEGHRMVGTAGTDIHGPLSEDRRGYSVVFAADRTESAILDGIRQGHLYLSAGPRVGFTAQAGTDADGQTAGMGDMLDYSGEVAIEAQWEDCAPDAQVRLICNGQVREAIPANGSGEQRWTVNASIADGDTAWCLLEIRDAQGDLWAVTNPIFFGPADRWR